MGTLGRPVKPTLSERILGDVSHYRPLVQTFASPMTAPIRAMRPAVSPRLRPAHQGPRPTASHVIGVSHIAGSRYHPCVAALRAVPTDRSGALPSDAELVKAARAGEPWASDALFRRHARRINGLALRLIGRDSDVDDLVQDSFASAFASLDRLKEPEAFGGWLSAILVRTASKLIRRRRLLARLGFGRDALAIDLDALVSASVPPDEASELRRLYSLAQKLPSEIRIPLLLQRVEGMELDEISKLAGCSIATTKRRIEKAEELLRSSFIRGEGR